MTLMMDAAAMYPRGFHPVQQKHTLDLKGLAPVIPRLGVWPPVKYYFVDYGISVRVPPEDRPQVVVGNWGFDQDVPELSMTTPYDPFKVDIFIIGNVFKKKICDVSCNQRSFSYRTHVPSRSSRISSSSARWRRQ